jgi:hypothetical protein
MANIEWLYKVAAEFTLSLGKPPMDRYVVNVSIVILVVNF